MTSPNLNVFGGRPRGRRLSTSSSLAPKKSRMPSLFNIIRLGVYTGILICTAIVLGIAAHFQAILVSSDLTHFVPFAIFVSCASLLVILALLVSTFFKQKSRISTRIELACLGFLAVVWLALGSFLAASASAEADVECFSADSTLEDPVELHSFTTDIFHAQYRVLEAFSIFNIILVWGFLLFLLFLVLRQHFRGNKKVWMHPVPVYPWFSSRSRSSPHMNSRNKSLPAPVTAMPSRRKGSTRRPHAAADVSKPKMAEYRKSAFWVWVERPREVPAARTRAQTRDRERERDREHERAHEQRRGGEPSNPPRRTHSSRRPAQK